MHAALERPDIRQYLTACHELFEFLLALQGRPHTRRESVEHPFGSIKQWMGQGAFLTRRLENMRGEFSITALAYNIRRAISLVGVPALIAAARA